MIVAYLIVGNALVAYALYLEWRRLKLRRRLRDG